MHGKTMANCNAKLSHRRIVVVIVAVRKQRLFRIDNVESSL